MTATHFIIFFCAGGLGAISRFALASMGSRILGGPFPWGTLVVNMLGCFIFGLIVELAVNRVLSQYARIILLVGFVGSFTTFSSLIFDCISLGNANRLFMAFLNITFQNIVGFLFLYLGLCVIRLIFK